MNISRKRYAAVVAAFALLPVLVSGCSSTVPNSSEPAAQERADAQDPVSFDGPWAKAADGMSGVFGTLRNHSGEDLTLLTASSPRADIVELHETAMVDGRMVMRELEGGFTIPAHGTKELVPGEDHIMLMELDRELLPGEVLPLTLTLSNGDSITLDIDVREYAGAEETYGDLEDHGEHHE